jgi:hypothetical protein
MTGIREIKRLFLNSLKRGTGEAYLIALANPDIDFTDQIIKGVLNIYAYDGQCEINRARYILDLIDLSNQNEKIRKAVLSGLVSEQKNTWNLTHVFAIAKLYAEKGDDEVKQAMYRRYGAEVIDGSDWVGETEILELDGLSGLYHISETVGKSLANDPSKWTDDSLIRQFDELYPSQDALAKLDLVATQNEHIRIYVEHVRRYQLNEAKDSSLDRNSESILDWILTRTDLIPYRTRRNISIDNLIAIAKLLVLETRKAKLERLLDIFELNKFPLDPHIILSFAQNHKDKGIARKATRALKHLKSDEIRQFAIDGIRRNKNPFDFIEIFVSNYSSGDEALLSEFANKTNNLDQVEQLAYIYTKIFEAYKTPECRVPLEILYSKSNCALHRHIIIKILIENNVLSDALRNEIRFDCDLDTRKLA